MCAQTNVAQTNVYVALNTMFHLTAQVQGPDETTTVVRITTRELIDAIGTATSNTFSMQARLLLLFRVGGGVPFFVVRDENNEVHAQGVLTATQIGQPITKLSPGGRESITGTIYVTEEFRLVNAPGIGFDVRGFNVDHAQQPDSSCPHRLLPCLPSILQEPVWLREVPPPFTAP
jgi:hypothetical protein